MKRGAVERFVAQVAGAVQGDTVVVMCTPWIGSPVPPRVLTCRPQSAGGAPLTGSEVQQVRNARVLLVPCNLQTPSEEETARNVIQQLVKLKSDDAFMLLILVLEEQLKDGSSEASDIVVERHRRAMYLDCDAVIVNPATAPRKFNESIKLANISWSFTRARSKEILESQPGTGNIEYLEHIMQKHAHLLWDKIPRALLRGFPPCDPHTPETGNTVGQYEFAKVVETRFGTVLQAVDKRSQTDCVIKITEKSAVLALAPLEDLYREFVILKSKLSHPNITKCLQILHTPSRVYMILNFCGSQNLEQFLDGQPNKCLEGVDGEACFKQLVGAVAHCHSVRVTHRSISLEHIVVMKLRGTNSLQCTLVDFRRAVESAENRAAYKVCGTLPCIAPEMALGGPYMPLEADCWSVGVVLLEIAGGLGAVQRAARCDEEEDFAAAATSIQRYFEAIGSQHEVLSQVPATMDPSVLELAEVLVRPVPAERADMRHVASVLKVDMPD